MLYYSITHRFKCSKIYVKTSELTAGSFSKRLSKSEDVWSFDTWFNAIKQISKHNKNKITTIQRK